MLSSPSLLPNILQVGRSCPSEFPSAVPTTGLEWVYHARGNRWRDRGENAVTLPGLEVENLVLIDADDEEGDAVSELGAAQNPILIKDRDGPCWPDDTVPNGNSSPSP